MSPLDRTHLISLTRGSGCITTIFFLATVMMWGVRMNWPKHCGRTRMLLLANYVTNTSKIIGRLKCTLLPKP